MTFELVSLNGIKISPYSRSIKVKASKGKKITNDTPK